MGRHGKYPAEVRERAVRLVMEQQGEHGSQWEAIGSIAGKIGCTAETLRRYGPDTVRTGYMGNEKRWRHR